MHSLWTGYHWKDIFLVQVLSISDAFFGLKVITSKAQQRLLLITGSYGQHSCQWVKVQLGSSKKGAFSHLFPFCITFVIVFFFYVVKMKFSQSLTWANMQCWSVPTHSNHVFRSKIWNNFDLFDLHSVRSCISTTTCWFLKYITGYSYWRFIFIT